MLKVSDIEDQDSLEAWLLDRPEDEAKTFAITIAHRAAMRVLPIYWGWVEKSGAGKIYELLSLPILRCDVITGTAQKKQTVELKAAAAAASAFFDTTSAAISKAGKTIDENFSASGIARLTTGTGIAFSSAFLAVAIINASTSAIAAHSAILAADPFSEAATALWKQILNDCEALENGDILLATPLWNSAENPFQKEWDAVRTSLSPDWSFWINWYRDALEGREPDWDMLAEIALIPDGDWEKGPARVNFLIGEIQAKYLSARAPLAERVEFNPQSASFYTTPQQPKKPDLLAATLSQVADAIDDALADAGNGLRKESREVRVLNRTLQRYSNDPQRIEMDFTSVAIGLRRQIRETKELPESEGNLALLNAVEEGARAIRATHPDVAENRMILAGQALRELPEEDRAVLGEAKEVLVAISEGAMAEDFAEDIPQLINDALLPLPNGAPPLPAVDPAVRMFGRVSRMAMMMQKSGEVVEQVEKSKSFRALKIVKMGVSFYGWLSSLVSIGLRLFGIL